MAATRRLTLPRAVVFDCDGTIVDSEPLSRQAWDVVLQRYGYQPTDRDVIAVIGRPWPAVYAWFAGRVALPPPDQLRAERRRIFHDLLDGSLEAFPDAVAAMRELAAQGVRLAVTSSSSSEHVRRALEVACVDDLVEVALGADDVERHKPDPEPYSEAAARLGVAVGDCVAVEDTPTGVASAVAAGMFTVAVHRQGDRGDLGAAHRVVDHIEVEHLCR